MLSYVVTESFFPEMDWNSGSMNVCEVSLEWFVKNLVLTIHQVLNLCQMSISVR